MRSLLKGRANKLFNLFLFFIAHYAHAAAYIEPALSSPKTFKHAEISAAGGFNWYLKHDTRLIISSFETDNNKIARSSIQGSWKAGLGYSFFVNSLPYFNTLLLNLNLYQTSTTLSGTVWQYELPQFNNYNFTATTKSTRLMLD